MDLRRDIFGELPYGQAALEKLGKVPENFRLYAAGWLGKTPEEWKNMKLVGAEFREATKGPNAGQLCKMIPGTQRTVYLTREEVAASSVTHAQPLAASASEASQTAPASEMPQVEPGTQPASTQKRSIRPR